MKSSKMNIENYHVSNPVKITKEQITQSHIQEGFSPEKAAEMAERDYQRIIKYVPEKYQQEVDYFLTHHKTTDSDTGKEIELERVNVLNRFFEALIAVARWDQING